MIVEGLITGLVKRARLIDFRIGERQVCVERTPASARLRDGDHVRVSLQQPAGDRQFHVIAFQSVGEGRAHFTGPQLGLSATILAALLLATSVLTGMGYLLVPAASLLLFDKLVCSDRATVLARFRAP
jgi:hypothetical protein